MRDSIRKGDAVVVHGRLRTDVWEREDGQSSTTYVVEATFVGHDLNRGTTVFLRSTRADRTEPEDETQNEMKAIIHNQPDDLPQLTSEGDLRPGHESAA